MRHTLKNYEKYLLKIKTLAKVLSVKITFKTEPSDGKWIPTKRQVVIDPDLTEVETISTLLHEFGHIIDDSSVDDKSASKIGTAYTLVYTDYYSTEDVIVVSLAERRAWNYGIAIAKNIGIKIGKWYHVQATSGVRGYKKLARKATK